MKEKDNIFPSIKKGIEDFLEDEDGNITRSKLVMIGAMMLLMTALSAIDAHAKHGSHKSHESHSSTAYIRNHGNHGSHSNHSSHSSHSEHASHSDHGSHASHTSHSNDASHSNSLYSDEGDVEYGPSVDTIPNVMPEPVNTDFDIGALEASTAAIANIDTSILNVPDVPEVQATKPMNDIQLPDIEEDINLDLSGEPPLGKE